MTFPQTLVLRYSQMEPEERRLPQIVDDYTRWFFSRLRAVEAAMKTRTYFCADRFTAADTSVGYALLFADRLLGLGARFSPTVRGYFEHLQARKLSARNGSPDPRRDRAGARRTAGRIEVAEMPRRAVKSGIPFGSNQIESANLRYG